MRSPFQIFQKKSKHQERREREESAVEERDRLQEEELDMFRSQSSNGKQTKPNGKIREVTPDGK